MSDDALDQHLIYKIIKHARRDVYVHDDVYILLNDIPEKSFKDINTVEKYSDFLYENGGYINEMLYLLGKGTDYFLIREADNVITNNLIKSATKN